MPDEMVQMVPFSAVEMMTARLERANKRLWILCLIMFLALVASNAAWIWYESQFVETVVEQEVDTGIGDAVVTGIGDISYGAGEADGQN